MNVIVESRVVNKVSQLHHLLAQHIGELRAEFTRKASTTAPADREKLQDAVDRLCEQMMSPKPLYLWFDSPLEAVVAVHLLVELCGIDSRYWPVPVRNTMPHFLIRGEGSGTQNLRTIDLRVWFEQAMLRPVGFGRFVDINHLHDGSLAHQKPYLQLDKCNFHDCEAIARKIVERLDMQAVTANKIRVPLTADSKVLREKLFDSGKDSVERPVQTNVRRFSGWHAPVADAVELMLARLFESLDLITTAFYQPYCDAFDAGGWWWPMDGVCVVSENPVEMHLENGVPHHLHQPAVRFKDWDIYAVHGMQVPASVIRNEFTLVDIQQERNVETRRVMIERFGHGRYIQESGAEMINSDEYGRLYRMPLRGDEPLLVVEVINKTPEPDGTYKVYHLRVPPTMTSAREAVAWSFQMEGDEYLPAAET